MLRFTTWVDISDIQSSGDEASPGSPSPAGYRDHPPGRQAPVLRIAASVHDATIALDDPMNLFILGATGIVTLAALALIGAFASTLTERAEPAPGPTLSR